MADYEESSIALAALEQRAGNWAAALEHYQQALDGDPSLMRARLGMGVCLLHMGRAAEAQRVFEECLGGAADTPVVVLGPCSSWGATTKLSNCCSAAWPSIRRWRRNWRR